MQTSRSNPGASPAYYTTIEDAVTEFNGRINCTTPEQDEILRAYFARTLAKAQKGYYVNGQAPRCTSLVEYTGTADPAA